MIDSQSFLSHVAKHVHLITGVPCSYFKGLLSHLASHASDFSLQHVLATREDEAIGIASGFALSGKRALVYMQNSGFANIGDALTSLTQLYKLPMLILVSYRGLEPDKDFPEHSLMGDVTEPVLKAYKVPYFTLTEQHWKENMATAIQTMEQVSSPVVLLVKQGVLG